MNPAKQVALRVLVTLPPIVLSKPLQSWKSLKKSKQIIPDQIDTTLKYLQTLFLEHTSL